MKYVACKTFDSAVVIDGSSCITTMQELYTCIVDKHTTELFIRHDFANEYFTPSSLSQFIKDVKRVNSQISVDTDAMSVDFMVEQVKRLHGLRDRKSVV